MHVDFVVDQKLDEKVFSTQIGEKQIHPSFHPLYAYFMDIYNSC